MHSLVLHTVRSGRKFGLNSLFPLIEMQRTRKKLANLKVARLKDVGLTVDDARNESERLIWDVPSNWRL